jgi:hypothetical protein
MQKLIFAYNLGKMPCLFLSHLRVKFGKNPFLNNVLDESPGIGPLLDKSLKPGLRPA